MAEVGSPGRCVGCSDACQEQGWLPALLVGRKYRAEVLVTPFPDHSLCPGDGLGSDLPPVPLLTKGMLILALKAPVWAGSHGVQGLKGIKWDPCGQNWGRIWFWVGGKSQEEP